MLQWPNTLTLKQFFTELNRTYNRPMIWYASCLHMLWAVLIIGNESAINVTATHGLYIVFDGYIVPVLIIASLMPFVGFLFVRSKIASLLFMLPQQFILFISATVAVRAVYLGQFPDGVARSGWFIAADQSPAVLAALFYSWAVIQVARRDG